MHRSLSRCCLAAALLIGQVAWGADFANRRVQSILDELRAQGITFIYNTDSVPEELRVAVEPKARSGVELAREILADHSLALRQVAPNVFAVVPAIRSIAPAAPAIDSSKPSALDEIVVHASRYRVSMDGGMSQTSFTQEQVRDMPRLADEPLRVLQRLPGTTTNGFSSLSSIRGGEPNEVAVILDGLRLYEPFHLKNFLSPVSILDSRLIQSMDFYAGGYPTIYGDRMSAIIDATSVQVTEDRYYEAGLTLFHVNALTAFQLQEGRSTLLVSARRSNAPYLADLSESEFGEPSYSDGFARVQYVIGEATRGSFAALISGDRVEAIKDRGTQRAQVEYQSAYTWATLQHDWSESAASQLIVSHTAVTNDRSGSVDQPGQRIGYVNDRRVFHVAGVRLDNEATGNVVALFSRQVVSHFGLELRRLWADYDYSSDIRFEPGFPFPGSPAYAKQNTVVLDPDGYEASAYWDGQVKFGDRLTANLGLRLDTQTYDDSGDAEQWSPRVGLLYQQNERTEFRVSWGRFFQSQGINELQVEDGIDRFHPAQHTDHTIVSVNRAFANGANIRLEAYRKDYRRLSPRFENLFGPLVLLPELEFDRVKIEPDGARSEGVELLLRLQPQGSWSGWFGYGWARVQDRVEGRYVPRSWDQKHAINLGVVWARGPWAVSIADSFHTGWPTTELNYVPPGTSPLQVAANQRNRARLEEYNSFDLRISRTFALRRGVLDVFVEASNALAEENPCCVNYSATQTPNGGLHFTADVDNWLPLVPSAGILWRY